MKGSTGTSTIICHQMSKSEKDAMYALCRKIDNQKLAGFKKRCPLCGKRKKDLNAHTRAVHQHYNGRVEQSTGTI
jgi:hypothetical protein